MSSTVISFDIGIKNLAYCILQKERDNDTTTTQIQDWNVINLMTMPVVDTNADHTIDVVKCNCMMKGKGTGKVKGKSTVSANTNIVCGKPAKFRKGEHTFCGVHAKTVVSAGRMPSTKESEGRMPSTERSAGRMPSTKESEGGMPSTERSAGGTTSEERGPWMMPKVAYTRSKLNVRKKPELEVLATEVGCTLIPGNKSTYVDQLETWFRSRCLEPVQEPGHVAAKDMDLITLGRHMCAHLDHIFDQTRSHLQITHVIMENQISTLASRMKTIQGELTMYFLIHYPNVHIEYVSSTHKLRHFAGVLPVTVPAPNKKICTTTTNEIVSSVSLTQTVGQTVGQTVLQTVGAKYREHKHDAIEITTYLLKQNPVWSAQWQHTMSHKKKDDYADCFLQGLWYVSTIQGI